MEAGRRRRRLHRWTDKNVDLTDEPNRKRTKTAVKAADRFSALPESLILRILSTLPIREVIIRTTTLSKNFHRLWTQVPNLLFDPVSANKNNISFVTKTLALRRGSKIDKLSLVSDGYVKSSVIDQWIDFAMTCNVESLKLGLSPQLDPEDDYTLPDKIYTSSSLRELDLLWIRVEPVGEIRLKSLNHLCIRCCDYSNDKMSQILAACPVLEFLEIDCRDVLDRFVLASKSVRKIRVRGGWETTLPLLCMPLLVDAYLDLSIEHSDKVRCPVMRKLSREVIDSLRRVEKLTLTTWFIQVLSMWSVEASPSQLVNCRYLTLETGIEEWEFPGIAILLHVVPNLEKLDLKFGYAQRY